MARASPRVSVLMSVYNDPQYLPAAIESMLRQSFSDFELVIVDDGSTDETSSILARYNDDRIVCLRNPTNMGLAYSLNRALATARGIYVARQDADDLSSDLRLACQVSYLDLHPDVAVVGTSYYELHEERGVVKLIRPPTGTDEIRDALFYEHTFCHSAVMMRRCCVEAVGGYYVAYRAAQDRDLWLRLAERFEMANLDEPLHTLRVRAASVSSTRRAEQRALAQQAARCALSRGVLRPSARALGRFYWLEALEATAAHDHNRAHKSLTEALLNNAELDADWQYLIFRAVHRAYECSHPSYRSEAAAEGVSLLRRIFSMLPNDCRLLRRRENWALGELNASFAHLARRAASPSAALGHCLLAWHYRPSLVLNRGLVRVLAESLATSARSGDQDRTESSVGM